MNAPNKPQVANATSRREFLRWTGQTVALSTLAGMAVPHCHAAQDSTIQLALVGCGGRGTGAIVNALSTRGGPVKLVFFGDMGNTYHEDQGWQWSQYRKTAGVELRIFLPIFQAPIRFIYGYNLDPYPEEDQADFQFSIGTTF